MTSFSDDINKMLIEKLDGFIIVYIDDILIDTNKADYVDSVQWFFNKPWKYFLYANLKKCCFHQEEDFVLAYIISIQGIYISDEQIEGIYDWPDPCKVRDIKLILGLLISIDNLSRIIA